MLKVRDLMVFYENMVAINNVSLECRQDQILGIFGANSAGKSTLCYAISGIILDMAHKEKMAGGERITVLGDIEYKGVDISEMKPSKRGKKGIILCPERRRIFAESSVLENLRIGGYLASSSQAKKTLKYVFETFEPLAKLKKREGGFLSGGEQQMLAIGRALMAQPELLILDEPLLGLSPLLQITLIRSIKKIKEERGITTIIAEQYARPVLPIVDYAYIIENGAAVLAGESDELMENPDVRAAYFGL